VEIYDVAGRRVRRLLEGPATLGINTLPWDGRGDAGETVAADVYFATLRQGSARCAQRLVVVR
jgi:flagellar hook assembly protein FlgD